MSSAQDRNLPATAHRLDQARKDGEASRSRDMSNLAVLGAGAAATLVLTAPAIDRLQHALGRQLVFNAATLQDPAGMVGRLSDIALLGLGISALFAVIVSFVVILATVAAGGWIASTKPLMPNFGRLNPLAGVGNLFSKQSLVNVGKLVLLSAVLGAVAWMHLRGSVEKISALAMQPSNASLAALAQWLASGMSMMLLVVFAVAVVDVPLQKFFFLKKLKMSHEEVKQEHKNSEGSPEVKGKIRQRQREMAQRKSIANVPKADFVLMNPTHYAVALKYDEATMAAPQVIAKGADLLAMRIREVAKAHQVPVLQSPMLARALYAHAELEQGIPSALYAAVAQVLAYVYRLKAALRGEGAMPAAEPRPEPLVPPELDPHHHQPAVPDEAAARAAAGMAATAETVVGAVGRAGGVAGGGRDAGGTAR
ncbi:MAG: EscU/YscU/HrcU family type III secretion system export apparatus switch protein [Xylophilus ampelinus]